ncbi:MAG: CCC motif membrane protein [Paludibacteraceae bacterium]
MTEIQKQNAPYAVAALVLGICSLLFGCFFVGLVCGIVGLVLANKGLATYQTDPALYSGYGMLKAGKITSILGIIFGAIYVFYYIIAVAILGAAGFAWLDWMSMFS